VRGRAAKENAYWLSAPAIPAPPVWNTPTSNVFNLHAPRAAWSSAMMFDWAAQRAERVGDTEALKTNRANAKVAAAVA
jgi:hypothetical protein